MTIFTVSSAAELTATLSKSLNGDVIQLAAGSYGNVTLSGVNIAGNVTITSADPNNQAVINGLMVKGSSGLTFSNLDFHSVVSGLQNPFQVLGSQNIVLDHLTVHGPSNLGSGLESQLTLIRASSNVTVSNSEFFDGWHALNLLDNKGVTVANNYIHDIRTDGVRGGGNSDLVVTKNTFTDFHPAVGDHPDAVQLWTTNTNASVSNITITDNLVVRGQGAQMQGIFIRDVSGSLPFQNVTITGNMITGGLYNGIAVDHIQGGTIADNIVAGYADQRSWIAAYNSTGLTVANNASTFWPISQSAWSTSSGNTTIPSVTDGGSAMVSQWLTSHSGVSSVWGSSDSAFLSALMAGISMTAGGVTSTTPTPTNTTPTPTDTTSGGSTGNSTGGTTGGSTDTPTTTPTRAGSGDDSYTVRSAADVVTEAANSGNDTVHSYIDYTLGANVENLWLEAAGLAGKGNTLDNLIVGSGGVDTINGMNGNDTLKGNGGDDFIRGHNGNDILRGDDGNDRLFGDAGNDVLFGGKGNDVMTGGTGNDVFAFATGDFGVGNMDKITDFVRGQDKLDFNLVQLSSGGDFKFIGTAQFHNVVGELRYQVQKGNAVVQGDIDGDGKADFAITLQKVTGLGISDFIL